MLLPLRRVLPKRVEIWLVWEVERLYTVFVLELKIDDKGLRDGEGDDVVYKVLGAWVLVLCFLSFPLLHLVTWASFIFKFFAIKFFVYELSEAYFLKEFSEIEAKILSLLRGR